MDTHDFIYRLNWLLWSAAIWEKILANVQCAVHVQRVLWDGCYSSNTVHSATVAQNLQTEAEAW